MKISAKKTNAPRCASSVCRTRKQPEMLKSQRVIINRKYPKSEKLFNKNLREFKKLLVNYRINAEQQKIKELQDEMHLKEIELKWKIGTGVDMITSVTKQRRRSVFDIVLALNEQKIKKPSKYQDNFE